MPLLAGIGPLGVPELLIIAFIILLVFGVGRLPEVGGALGKGIREFRKSSTDDDQEKPSGTSDVTAPAADVTSDVFCQECGTKNASSAKFCASCGKPLAAPVG